MFQGKKHIEWFSENFEQVLDAGAKELAAVNEMAKQCDQYLKLQDSFTVRTDFGLKGQGFNWRCTGLFKH